MEQTTEDEMRAFQDYMLGSSSPAANSLNVNSPVEYLSSPPRQQHNFLKKAEKRCWSIFKKFCSAIKDDWLFIDEEIYTILQSIQHIRVRFPKEQTILDSLKEESKTSLLHSLQSKYDHRNKGSVISQHDVHNALSYDLQRHEYYIKNVSKLMVQLVDNHEYIHRILDDAMYSHEAFISLLYSFTSDDTNDSPLVQEEDSNTTYSPALSLMDDMNDLFQMLSREIYRKQCLYSSIIESVDDSMLLVTDTSNGVGVDSSNDNVFQTLVRTWSSNSKESLIDLERFNIIFTKSNLQMKD